MNTTQEEPKQEWTPTQGETVWIKVFSNWSKGTYIGYDVVKQTHLVREDEKDGGYLMSSSKVLPYYSMPNKPKQETLEEAAERLLKDKYGVFISKDADVKGQLVIDTANAAFVSGVKEGAKWQAERMYTYDELRKIAYNAYCLGQLEEPTENKYNLWIQQFKKK